MSSADTPFDAVFEVGGEEMDLGDLVSAVKDVGTRLGDWIDPVRSAAIAGMEHVIVPGSQRLELVFALRRLPALSPEQFRDHWLNVHAEIARGIGALQGYRQFHADDQHSEAAAASAGVGVADFEGAAEAYYQNSEAFLKIMSEPAVAADALADERTFIDHSRSVLGLYRTVWDSAV